MKYVRLKNMPRIISYDENANDLDKPMIIHYPSEVVKETDTIEELCDAFVYVSKEDGNHMFHMNGKPRYSKFDDIYGAIWTDKGLIYVAKINEKGVWELL